MIAPGDVDAQRAAALKKANEARYERARLKKEMRDSDLCARASAGIAADVLESKPWWVATMRLGVLLCAVRQVDEKVAKRIVGRANEDWLGDPVGGLTDEQREKVTGYLRTRHGR